MANFYLLHVFLAIGVLCAIAEADCNPLVNASCPAIPGLATNTYSVDFTQQTATPSDWIQAEGETVTYDSQNGATFTFANRYDAPYIWSRFYLLFGHVEVVVKIAKGEGIITAATLLSDDLDEVDWEWSGNNFDQSSGLVQTNYFGKGVTGDYDRSTTVSVSDPQDEFHTYTWDWTPSALTWSIDGTSIRTLTNNYQTTGDYQYPQTPSRIHLGVWDAGDPGNNPATIYWGGGTTNISLAPFSGYVKSVKVTTSTPCSSYQYPNSFNGTYEDVLCTNQTIIVPCTYSVAAGDNGQTIADSLGVTLDALKAANPNIDWDLLIVGQTLKVPGGDCPTSTTSTTRSTTSTTLSTTSTTLSTTSLSFNFANTSTTTSRTSNTTPSMISSNTSTVIITTTVTSSISLTSTSSAAPSSGPSQTAVATTASSASPTAALSTFNSVSLTSAAPTVTTAGTPAATSTQSATYSLYTVVAGDYGYEIASKLGCSFDALSAVNSGVDWDMLMPGQTLNIPCTVSGASSIGATVVSQPSATSAAGTGSISASGQSVVSSSGPGQQSPAAAATTGGVSVDSASAAATTLPDSSPAAATQSNTSIPGSIQSSAAPTALSNIADSSSTSCTTLPADSQAAATSTPYWSNSTVASSFVASNATSLSVMSSTAPTSPTASDFAAATTTVLPDDDDTSAAPTSQSTTTISGTTVTSTSSLLMSSQTTSDMVSPTTQADLANMVCNQDNCLRNMMDARYSSAMLSFCPTYTIITSNPAPLPTFLGNCVGDTSRVSSACSCLMTSYASSDPTPTISNMVSPTTPASLAKVVCNQDNCLRNMMDARYSSAMLSFCPSYTTITSNPTPLPTFLGNCVNNTSRVSSACSCLMTSYAPTIHASSETPAMTAAAMQGGSGSLRLKRTPLRWERALV